MKKIGYILFTDRVSGAEKIAIEIIKELEDRYECTYICKSGEIEEVLKKKKIRYKTFKTKKELISIIKNGKFDIIHANDYQASIVASAFHKNVISHIHNNKVEMTKLSKLSIIYTLASFRIKKIICVSNSVKGEMFFRSLLEKKSTVRYNWINKEERYWKKEEERKIDILFVGRFEEQKNPIMFVDTIKDIVNRGYENLKVVMIGRGSLKENTIKYIKKNSLENNIEIKDFTDEPHKYMKQSKIFYTPSRFEGFGLVFLEAIVNGSVPVATPVGGIKEIFIGKEDYLCSEKNEFVEKIDYLLKNENERTKVAEGNMSILERFDMKKNIKKIEEFYK